MNLSFNQHQEVLVTKSGKEPDKRGLFDQEEECYLKGINLMSLLLPPQKKKQFNRI